MDLLTTGQLLVGLIAALGGGSVVLLVLTLKPTRRKIFSEAKKNRSEGEKSEAEAADLVARAAAGMLSPMEATIASLGRQLRQAHTEVESLNAALRAANKRIGELEDAVEVLTRNLDRVAAREDNRDNREANRDNRESARDEREQYRDLADRKRAEAEEGGSYGD